MSLRPQGDSGSQILSNLAESANHEHDSDSDNKNEGQTEMDYLTDIARGRHSESENIYYSENDK